MLSTITVTGRKEIEQLGGLTIGEAMRDSVPFLIDGERIKHCPAGSAGVMSRRDGILQGPPALSA